MAHFYRDTNYDTIYIEQTVDGKRFRRSIGMKVPADKWDARNSKAVNNLVKSEGMVVNTQLGKLQLILIEAINELSETGGGLKRLYELYDEKVIGKRTIKPSGAMFMPYFKQHYEMLMANGKSTGKSFRTTYRRLEKFWNGAEPTFSQINPDFYERFGIFLETDCNLAVTTISKQWANIKKVMKICYIKKLHKNQDYKEFVRKDEDSENISLTQEEVDKIANVTTLTGYLDKVRDYFLIQCLTGAAYSDITKVNLDNVNKGILNYRRKKSDEDCSVPIHPKVYEILKKYNGNLPVIMSNQKYNDYLKLMCKEAGITGVFNYRITKGGKTIQRSKERWKAVSSHAGRRTFATLHVLANTPVNLIMMMTGHKTLESFDKYIHLRKLQGEEALKDLKWFKETQGSTMEDGVKQT